MVKPLKHNAKPEDENKYSEKLAAAKAKATRHLVLIRHGQYNLSGATDAQRFLTDIGIVCLVAIEYCLTTFDMRLFGQVVNKPSSPAIVLKRWTLIGTKWSSRL